MAQPSREIRPTLPSVASVVEETPHIVSELKKKKKKRKFSQGLRTIQDVERGVTTSLTTLSVGVLALRPFPDEGSRHRVEVRRAIS